MNYNLDDHDNQELCHDGEYEPCYETLEQEKYELDRIYSEWFSKSKTSIKAIKENPDMLVYFIDLIKSIKRSKLTYHEQHMLTNQLVDFIRKIVIDKEAFILDIAERFVNEIDKNNEIFECNSVGQIKTKYMNYDQDVEFIC